MKRTLCCFASSPSSCGSMMTKRFLSYSKCRSIRGKVPLPIEPKPIMTMGPEIFAWIFEAGLMGMISEKVLTDSGISGGATLGGHFDLDLHLRLEQAGNDQQGGGRADVAEHLAADRKMRVGILDVGEIIGRADDIGHGEACLLQGGLDGLEAVARLACDIRRHGHGGVVIAGGARDEGKIAVDHGAAIPGGLLKWRAGRDQAAGHVGPRMSGSGSGCRALPSAHFPKFVLHRSTHLHELRKVMGTSKLIESSTALSI